MFPNRIEAAADLTSHNWLIIAWIVAPAQLLDMPHGRIAAAIETKLPPRESRWMPAKRRLGLALGSLHE